MKILVTISGVGILVPGSAEQEVVAVVVQGDSVHLVVDIPDNIGSLLLLLEDYYRSSH